MSNIDLKNRVLGAGNRILTIIGAVAGALVALGQYLELVPPEFRSSKWYAIAAALVALGAAWRMPSKKEAVVDVVKTTIVLSLLLPALAFAQVDSTTSTIDAAGPADAVAQAAPDPRWSFKLGPVTVSPSSSFTPTVLSLKDFSLSVGPNVGAGFDFVWTKNGYGAATHATLRDTAVGMKPLASLYGILPFLAQYKVRPGVSYQFGGGSTSFKDAFILGFALSDNFGYAAK